YHLFLVLRVSLSDLLFLSSTHLFLTITTPSCSPLFPYTTLFRSVSRSEALEDLPLPSDLPPLEDLAAEPLDDRADEWPDSPRPLFLSPMRSPNRVPPSLPPIASRPPWYSRLAWACTIPAASCTVAWPPHFMDPPTSSSYRSRPARAPSTNPTAIPPRNISLPRI